MIAEQPHDWQVGAVREQGARVAAAVEDEVDAAPGEDAAVDEGAHTAAAALDPDLEPLATAQQKTMSATRLPQMRGSQVGEKILSIFVP